MGGFLLVGVVEESNGNDRDEMQNLKSEVKAHTEKRSRTNLSIIFSSSSKDQ